MIISEVRFRVVCDTCSDEHVNYTAAPHSFSPDSAKLVATESGYDISELHRCKSCTANGRTAVRHAP